jgi:hypothetical protein
MYENGIGLINPKESNEHRLIRMAIDYSIKWIQACFYAHVT